MSIHTLIIKKGLVVECCPDCGGKWHYYDTVRRMIREAGGKEHMVYVKRYRCETCGKIHRILPNNLYPYKQYDKEIIDGVISGLITSDTYGFEDYPCEMTMTRWKRSQNLHSL